MNGLWGQDLNLRPSGYEAKPLLRVILLKLRINLDSRHLHHVRHAHQMHIMGTG
jgi:hypothetical protein